MTAQDKQIALLMQEQASAALQGLGRQGLEALKEQKPEAEAPVISHICFKFGEQNSYTARVMALRGLGAVTQQMFKGKQISWCRLREPLRHQGMALEWLELVEPRHEANGFDGVTSVAYCVPGLSGTVKIPSSDGRIIFRYQGKYAKILAGE
jgi:hypothetical protein